MNLKFYLIIFGSFLVCSFVLAEPTEVKKGELVVGQNKIPSFYIWRRVYQKVGKSVFKAFLVKSDGSLVSDAKPPVGFEVWNKARMADLAGWGHLENDRTQEPTANGTGTVSPGGQWKITYGSSDEAPILLVNTKTSKSFNVPGFDGPMDELSRLVPLGWAPKDNLYYFFTSGGADTGRNNQYYQFDPGKMSVVHLGGGVWFKFSTDGKWIVWIDGFGMDYVDRQIHLFEIKTETDYQVTKDHSDNYFFEWADVVDAIQDGKKLYISNDFSGAINKYKTAISLDPESDLAYGLMGYSLLRLGKIDEAIKSLERSREISPGNLMTHYNLALAYWGDHVTNNAIEEIKAIFILDKGYKTKIHEDVQFKGLIQTLEYQQMEKKWAP